MKRALYLDKTSCSDCLAHPETAVGGRRGALVWAAPGAELCKAELVQKGNSSPEAGSCFPKGGNCIKDKGKVRHSPGEIRDQLPVCWGPPPCFK